MINMELGLGNTFLNIGILVEDKNRIIIAVNEDFCHIFNINKTPNELIGFMLLPKN